MKLTELNSIVKESKIMSPRGWARFDEDRLVKEKAKLLKQAGLSPMEIRDFLNAMPNSRLVNDVIRKIGAKGDTERFLRYQVHKNKSKELIDQILRRGY